MRIFLALAFVATQAFADAPPGFDDPAFSKAFKQALTGNDPQALVDLHALAETGNTAALLALPAASGWLRQGLTFAQRKRLARVNGASVAEAVAAADPVAALWNMGDAGIDTEALLTRAVGLYAAGEAEKGLALFMTWLNQTGGFGDLPPGLLDQPMPDWATAFLLRARLSNPDFVPEAEADALIVERLKADDAAAFMALAAFAGLHRSDTVAPDTARIAAILKAAGLAQEDAARRMAEAVPALQALYRKEDPLDPAIAEAAARIFADESEFQSLVVACQAQCPRSAQACTTAFVAVYGYPFGRTSSGQPFVSLISTVDFFATPRGRKELFRGLVDPAGQDPFTMARLDAARAIDACLADAVQQAAHP